MPEILVVKDDAAAGAALAVQLRMAGYDTRTATAVPEAMQILREGEPDLLITEVRLKGYNGLHLVAMAPRPLPAIVLTAHRDAVVETDARRLGAEYVSGPCSFDRLRRLIDATLRRAEERGVFLPARIDARSVLPVPISVTLGDSAARILDVSAGGARLEVQRHDGRTLAASLALRLDTTVIPVDVAWQRQVAPGTMLCGVTIDQTKRLTWAAVFSRYADFSGGDRRKPRPLASTRGQTPGAGPLRPAPLGD